MSKPYIWCFFAIIIFEINWNISVVLDEGYNLMEVPPSDNKTCWEARSESRAAQAFPFNQLQSEAEWDQINATSLLSNLPYWMVTGASL